MNEEQMKVISWLASDDTGISSESLAFQFLGVDNTCRFKHRAPSDPADLGRCLRLIDKVPDVRKCVDELALVDRSWACLAPVWDEISESMKNEVGIDWSKGRKAPITYQLMRNYRNF